MVPLRDEVDLHRLRALQQNRVAHWAEIVGGAARNVVGGAVVGDGLPNMFADGAAIGTFAVSMNFSATAFDGMRIATVSRPVVTRSGTLSDFFNTNVKGPGQKRAASFSASGGTSLASLYRSSIFSICTIRGSSSGRFLASKMPETAFASSAFCYSIDSVIRLSDYATEALLRHQEERSRGVQERD